MHLLHRDDLWIQSKLGIRLSKGGPWAGGGAVLQWYQHRPTHSDIDLFFANQEQFNLFKDQLEQKLRGGPEPMPTDITWLNPPFDYPFDKHESENAITYTIREGVTGNDLGQLQLIRRKFYSGPQECVEDFDISVCQIATDGNAYWFGEHTLNDIKNRQFRFTRRIGPSSARRFVKYHAYGFTAVDEAYDELFNADNVNWVRTVGVDDYA